MSTGLCVSLDPPKYYVLLLVIAWLQNPILDVVTILCTLDGEELVCKAGISCLTFPPKNWP
jgi:hypothetical protein